MAIRTIRTDGDEILRKKSRVVDDINDRIRLILDDMAETMHESNGIGLAAPQVGLLKKIFIIDIGEGVIEFINPEIISEEGEQEEMEGCLSLPGIWGIVNRPMKVKIKALDRNGKEIIMEGEELLARVISHENDHLYGILFSDKVIRFIEEDELEKPEEIY